MPIAVTDQGNGYATTVSTLYLTFLANVAAGSLIVVLVVDFGGMGTVSDGLGNTYTKVAQVSVAGGPGQVAIFYAWNCAAISAGQNIQYNKFDSSNGAVATAISATGIRKFSNPLDGSVTATNTAANTATPTVTTGTPARSNDLLVTALAWQNGGTTGFTQAAGWNSPPNVGDASAIGVEIAGGSKVQATKAAQTYTPTVTAMTTAYGMVAAGFYDDTPPARVGNMPMMGL